MIKAIIFDIGGVMASENNMRDHYLPLIESMKLDKDEFFKIRDKYVAQAAEGKMTGKAMIKLFAKELGVNYDKLLKNWIKFKKKSQKKNFKLEKIIKKLKKQRYIVGSLSSVLDIHQKVGQENKLYDVFDFNIYSYKVGFSKPDIRIYKYLLKKLKKIKPEEIIVVDDMQTCLDSAKKLGLKTILFRDNKQFVRDLKELGVVAR